MDQREERLARTEERFDELTMLMSDPGVLGDPKRYREITQEYHDLEPIVQAVQTLRRSQKELTDNRMLLTESDDQDFREMAREEISRLETLIEETEKALALALVPKDPLDDKNVIMEIRAGTGGEEAALFSADLVKMYLAYAAQQNWTVDCVDQNETELGGFREITLMIEGKGAYSRLKFESGTHRVQRVPETESGGRIHTSAVTVAVLPEAESVDLEIDPKDIQIDVYRSSGAGGQHVNKTSSAIRVTYLPTGLVVTCQDERSQHKNKDRALSVLRSRLLDEKRQAQTDAIAENRRSQVGSGDRSERIRTYNFPQSRVTDHRVGLTLYQLDQVLAGGLDPFITALQTADHEARLSQE